MDDYGWQVDSPYLLFFAPGVPRPKGSKRSVGRSTSGRTIMIESSKGLPAWSSAVEKRAREYKIRFHGPVTVHTEFVLPRPKKITGPMTGLGRTAGDGDKLTRAVWDALVASGTIEDDSRVLAWSGSKRVADAGETPGVHVSVRALTCYRRSGATGTA